MILESVNFEYGRGIHSALQSIFQTVERNNEAFRAEVKQFDVRLDENIGGGLMEELEGETLAVAISGLLDNPNLPAEIYDGIKRAMCDIENKGAVDLDELTNSPEYIAKVFELNQSKEQPEKPLDLSEHPENLNILANQISEIIHNPDLPESIRECLENELSETTHLDLYTPENVLANLKSIKEG